MAFNIQKVKVIGAYSVAHAIVDFCCAAVIYSFIGSTDTGFLLKLAVLYNILAFGLQSIFGLIVDKYNIPRKSAIFGCLFLILGLCLYNKPLYTIVLMGIGNALFHVGGGLISLRLGNGRAKLPGIFVAPGAIGLFLGTMLWKYTFIDNIWLAFLPLFAMAIIFFAKFNDEKQTVFENRASLPCYYTIILLLLFAIAVRSFVGLSYDFTAKENIQLMTIFIFGAAFGKFAGGFIADKFGMFRTALIGLFLSIPCLKFGYIPQFSIIGMFLFNLTMPITVTALANMMPNYKGFAFGLTTLALLLGYLPVYAKFKVASQSIFLFEIILVSAIVTSIALYLYEKLFNRP